MLKGTPNRPGRMFLSQDDNLEHRIKTGSAFSSLKNAKSYWESFGELMRGISTPERPGALLPSEALSYVEGSPDAKRYNTLTKADMGDSSPGRIYSSARKLAFSKI